VCRRHYSLAEAVKYYDMTAQAFVCHGQKMEEKTEEAQLSIIELEQKKKRLGEQINPLLELIKEVDNMKIPK